MRKIKILKRFNYFTAVQNTEGILRIEGKASKKIVNVPTEAKLLSTGKLFFDNRRIAYLYQALINSKINVSRLIHFKKLTLKGIGFKCFKVNHHLLMLKIGFTHRFYYHIKNADTNFLCKKTKIIIYGDNLDHVNTTTYTLKSLRYPDPYKGKGITFSEEIIKLKPSKKRI